MHCTKDVCKAPSGIKLNAIGNAVAREGPDQKSSSLDNSFRPARRADVLAGNQSKSSNRHNYESEERISQDSDSEQRGSKAPTILSPRKAAQESEEEEMVLVPKMQSRNFVKFTKEDPQLTAKLPYLTQVARQYSFEELISIYQQMKLKKQLERPKNLPNIPDIISKNQEEEFIEVVNKKNKKY